MAEAPTKARKTPDPVSGADSIFVGGFGKINFPQSGSSTLLALASIDADRSAITKLVTPDRVAGVQAGSMNTFPAIDGGSDVYDPGNMYQRNFYQYPTNQLLAIQHKMTFRGAVLRCGMVFILPARDNTAPELSVSVRMPSHPDASLGDWFKVYEGRGHVVPLEIAKQLTNINGAILRMYTDPTQVDECFDIVESGPRVSVEYVREAAGTIATIVRKQPPMAAIGRRRRR